MIMMKSILQVINDAMMQAAKERVRGELLRRSDRQLEDIGVSRELLRRGAKAWPWRIAGNSSAVLAAAGQARPVVVESLSEREIARAIAELNQYTDSELHELNLTRRDIPHAVRYGRPDHPNDLQQAA